MPGSLKILDCPGCCYSGKANKGAGKAEGAMSRPLAVNRADCSPDARMRGKIWYQSKFQNLG